MVVMLAVHSLPALADNYIWLIEDEHGRAVVVDPGDAAPVLAALEERGLELVSILVTHHHVDHVGGIADLLAVHPGIPVHGPQDSPASCVTEPLADGAVVDVLGTQARIMTVPGHTLDHIAYFIDASGDMAPLLFCGDVLFAGGCGRIFEGDAPMMHASLQRLAVLPPPTRVFCAHEYTLGNLDFALVVEPGNAELQRRSEGARAVRQRGEPTLPTTLALELATNPFLRGRVEAVRLAAAAHAGRELAAEADVFAVLRAWKDVFRG